MSGMSMLPSFGGNQGYPQRPDMASQYGEAGPGSQQHQRNNISCGDSDQSHGSSHASPLPPTSKGVSRPPGLGGPAPSPIGKPGHSKNSSASTAPSLALTPASSLDGSAEPYNMASFGSFDTYDGDNDGLLGLGALRERSHSSPGPFSSSPPVRSQIGPQGSYHDEQRIPRAVSKDGGRGAHGSRPPLSGGPGLSPQVDTSILNVDRNIGVNMPFGNSRSRDPSPPPNYTHDGPGVISRPDLRYADSSLRRSISADTGTEFLENAYSYQNNGGNQQQHSIDQRNLTQKFASLPSLNTQLSNQRMLSQGGYDPSHNPQMQRHQRSASVSGPVGGYDHYSQQEEMHYVGRRSSDIGPGLSSQRLPSGMDNDYGMNFDPRYQQSSQSHQQLQNQHGHHRAVSQEGFHSLQNRSMSMTNSQPSSGSLGSRNGSNHSQGQRRGSFQAAPTGNAGFYNQDLHRRNSLDFVPGQNRYNNDPGGAPVVASNEEMRVFAPDMDRMVGNNFNRQDRLVSPSHSPLHTTYGSHGSHSRHPSDMGNASMSSSPMSLGSAGAVSLTGRNSFSLVSSIFLTLYCSVFQRGMHGHGHDMYGSNARPNQHRVQDPDEDLSHPLLGEHIDVPADDQAYMAGQSYPQMRSSMGHSSSMEQMQGHYGDMNAAHHLPTAGSALPQPKVVYNVKFKRTQRYFVMGPRISRDLKVGTYVKVEADRGEDLGIVVGKAPSEKYNVPGRSNFRGGAGEIGIIPPPSGPGAAGAADLKRVIRLATHDEVTLLAIKREEEEELLNICRTKVRQRALPMHVVDAEYQFDRHKLTFFFEAEGRIDFRELVRDLFSIYKTRIWMQQLDKATSVAPPTGAAPPPPVMMDHGIPIIAPASEFSEFAGAMNGAPGDEGTE